MKPMQHSFRRFLEKITSKKAPGPSPVFSIFHVLSALELISEKAIGRSKLTEELGVGEGTVRTMIQRLKDAEIITTSKRGCTLTSKGQRLRKEYTTIFTKKVQIGKSELTLADYNFAVLVKNQGHKIKSGIEQRDAAIMIGAKGATTIIFKEGHLVIPSVSNDIAEDFPEAANQIIRFLKPEENDAIIIGSASDSMKAEYGALAAAWTILDDSD